MSRRKGFLALTVAVGVASAWFAAPEVSALLVPGDMVVEEFNECFADGWSAQTLEEAALELSTAAKPCRPCQGREWCGCTYPGGYNRISCDPCCYINYAGWVVCLD